MRIFDFKLALYYLVYSTSTNLQETNQIQKKSSSAKCFSLKENMDDTSNAIYIMKDITEELFIFVAKKHDVPYPRKNYDESIFSLSITNEYQKCEFLKPCLCNSQAMVMMFEIFKYIKQFNETGEPILKSSSKKQLLNSLINEMYSNFLKINMTLIFMLCGETRSKLIYDSVFNIIKFFNGSSNFMESSCEVCQIKPDNSKKKVEFMENQ